MYRILRYGWLLAAAMVFTLPLGRVTQAAPTPQAAFLQSAAQRPDVLYTLKLPHGKSAVVHKDGIAKIYSADFNTVETRMIMGLAGRVQSPLGVPTKAEVRLELSKAPPRPYAKGEVLVAYRDGVTGSGDVINVPAAKLVALRHTRSLTGSITASQAPKYTTSSSMNILLAHLGVDRSTRLFRGIDKTRLQVMSQRASEAVGRSGINLGNVYRLHLTAASVYKAVQTLRHSKDVAYASPAFYVTTMHTHPDRIRNMNVPNSFSFTPAIGTSSGSHLPSNYGLKTSFQSMFNSPSLNAASAYDEVVRRFGQLPGQGEIITNVSLGDLTDSSAASNPNDACYRSTLSNGPTTIVQGGQRYLNMPSMPLIPTWTADTDVNLDPLGEVCGVDPQIVEIGLDFSMMAPLPHDQQRSGEVGEGATDLLGIAPGADYRLVVPKSDAPTTADIDAALLAAAQQSPRPSVITASVGVAWDQYGFPSRSLEDDPLSAQVIASIVSDYHIVVTLASNDGLRLLTNAAVSPSGGAAPTNLAHGDPTDMSDISFSTMPSRDPDTGSIEVGGTTLDDIFAAPPQNSANAALKAQHAFAETRWTGSTTFASGFGSRVNVSAPSDNVIAFEHKAGGAADEVDVTNGGGVSASAPEVAASVAVLLQVARLTGQPFAGPKAVRDFLEATGTPVPKVPQSDVYNHVGPQVNLGHAVETLLDRAGHPVTPQVTSVQIEQRRGIGNADAMFQSDTNPNAIDLSGANTRAWITIAPNWEGLSADTSYTLRVTPASTPGTRGAAHKVLATTSGSGGILARTEWARVLPREIFAVAGVPFDSRSPRSFRFIYTATPVGATADPVTAEFVLTFGPSQERSAKILAPTVQSVVRGSTVTVHYDLRNTGVTNATLEVSMPGRVTPFTGSYYHLSYSTPIGSGQGMVDVPVSALQGGGIYGIGIHTTSGNYSDFAFTRVQPEDSSLRPPAPLLSANDSEPGHILEISYGEDFTVSWDVSDVPGATGATLEISAAGPNAAGSYSTFNNPNGSVLDDPKGVDTGSLYSVHLSGATGTIKLKGSDMAKVLVPTLYENLRVLPVSGDTIVGEASEISSITMDGIAASDGGSVSGWAVNGNGSDGFVTSVQQTASGDILTSLEIFDQTSNAITQELDSEINHYFYTPLEWGIYGNDLGLYTDYNYGSGQTSYHTLDPVAKGIYGTDWTPPSINIMESAANQETGTGVFYGPVPGTASFQERERVFTSDIAANTFSPLYDFSGPLLALGFGNYYGIAENTQTNTGVLAAADILNACGPPILVKFDLDSGEIKSVVDGVGKGQPQGIAIDSQTNKMAITTSCDTSVGIYDEGNGEAIIATLPGKASGFYTAADSKHHYFFVEQTSAPHSSGQNSLELNNNSLSVVYVLDEDGNIVKSLERFNLYNTRLPIQANNLRVSPAYGIGYLPGLDQQQIAPFKYMETNNPPIASDGVLTATEDETASGTLKASDPDGDALTFSIVDQPQHGSVTLNDLSIGAYSYTPNDGYSGGDAFTFKANDGQVDSNTATITVTVNAVAPPKKDSGGGALGWLMLVALLGLMAPALIERRRRT